MKQLAAIVFLLLFSEKIFSQSQGPLKPHAASYSVMGCLACPGSEWTDLTNITDPDNHWVNVTLTAQSNCFQTVCYYSRILYAFDFGFTIPAAAVITGVTADMIRMSTDSFSIIDSVVQLYTGLPVGSNHADSTFWPTTSSTVTYGGMNDMWGYTLTPDTINSQQFGFALRIVNKSVIGGITASVDNVLMTVYYTTGTGILSQTRPAGGSKIIYNEINNSITVISGSENLADLILISAEGKNLFEANSRTIKDSRIIYLPELTAGIYFALLQTEKKVFVEKIFISR